MRSRILHILRQSLADWIDDQSTSSAAAIAFYTIFSMVPMLLVVVTGANHILGEKVAAREFRREMELSIGEQAARTLSDVLASARESPYGGVAFGVGLAAMLLGATAVFSQVQTSLNRIWKVQRPPEPLHRQVLRFLWRKALTLAMAVIFGSLMVAFMTLGAVGGGLLWQFHHIPAIEAIRRMRIVHIVLLFLLMTSVLTTLYKVLPDAATRWRDAWMGAMITAALVMCGQAVINLYLTHATIATAFGAAGSFVAILLWVYYCAMVFLLGAEFTHVYAMEKRQEYPISNTQGKMQK